jgi:hypothetical protein
MMLEIQVLALDKHKNVSVLGPKPIQWQCINKQVIKKKYTYSLPLKKTTYYSKNESQHKQTATIAKSMNAHS